MLGRLLITLAVVQVVWARELPSSFETSGNGPKMTNWSWADSAMGVWGMHSTAKPIDIFNDPGEGDILQLLNLKDGTKAYSHSLNSYETKKWLLTDEDGNFLIPYTITGPFKPAEERVIAEAMKRIEKNTCIRFTEWDDEDDYIDLVNEEGKGCITNVGRVSGRGLVQLESSKNATCMMTPTVMHELMHVIGLWHEHQRYDRDEYIDVIFENIEKEYHNQFTKMSASEATMYKVPYSYTSVMHYGQRAFAKPNKISMWTKNPEFQDVIGNGDDASPFDYLKICEIYRCKQCMGRSH